MNAASVAIGIVGNPSRGNVCAVKAASSLEGNRSMGQHLRKICASGIAAVTTMLIAPQHAKSDDRSSAADCARAVTCHGRHGDSSEGLDIKEFVRGNGRASEPPARDGCATSIAGRLFLPTRINQGIV